jgi:type II secretory pathway pseudopilin PulG
MIVIGIISIILVISAINFKDWQRKSNIEKEVQELCVDLLYIQQQAMVTGMTHRINFVNANNVAFLRYSSEGDATGKQIMQKSYWYAISKSNWTTPSSNDIYFNPRGIMDDPTTKSICVFSNSNPASDSIVILQSKINLGKIRNQGSACDASNIDIK